MAFVLLSWLLLFVLVSAYGYSFVAFARKFIRERSAHSFSIFDCFWIGLLSVIAIFQLWNFFSPLNRYSLIVFLVLPLLNVRAIFGMMRARVTICQQCISLGHLIFYLLASAAILIICAQGVSTQHWSGAAYDTDLYHFNWIEWANEFPVIPGLANLHSRLGLNSGFLTFAALIDNLWWDKKTAWIISGFIVTVFAIQWMHYIICRHDVSFRVKLFGIFSLPYILQLVCNNQPTLYFDQPALLMQLLLFLELLRLYADDEANADEFERYTVILPVISLLGFSFKPIGALSVIFTGLVLILLFFRQHKNNFTVGKISPFIMTLVLCAVLLSGHLARNVMTTGWILFPAAVGKVDTGWTMPENPAGKGHWYRMQSVSGQYDVIKRWARLPDKNYIQSVENSLTSWFPGWYKRFKNENEAWLFFSGAVAAVLFVFFSFISRTPTESLLYNILLLAFSLSNIIYWFFGAPDLRFGDGFIWIFFSLAICLVISLIKIPVRFHFTVMILPFLVLCFVNEVKISSWKVDNLISVGKAVAGKTKVTKIHNNQDIPLFVRFPIKDDRCGDAAIPCTPYPLKNLMQRNPGVIGDGFYFTY